MTINVLTANTFKSTETSRKALLEKLTEKEKKLFLSFVASVQKNI